MGEVCKERKPWLRVVWQICNVFMCLFFALASYVQVRVWFFVFSALLWTVINNYVLTSAADQWSRCRFMDGKFTRVHFFLVHVFRHFDLFAQFIINTTLFFRLVTASLQSWVRVLLWSLMWQVQGWVWSHLPVDASLINNKVLILTCMKLVSYVAAELYSCISPVHVAPPCGCILTVQLVAEFGLWFQLFCLHYFCFLFRDFALEACCWPSCADFQCDQCHVGMDTVQRANHTDLPEGGGQVRHTSPDLRNTNRLRIFRLSIQKKCAACQTV